MVEETNEYYKMGLHKLYELFQDDELFAELREKYDKAGRQPTAQEIVRASGATSSDKVCESGVNAIKEHLASKNRPLLVRHGEWDRVQASDQPLSPSDTASSSDSPLMRSSATLATSDAQPIVVASPDPFETDRTPTPAVLQPSRPSIQPSAPAASSHQKARAAPIPSTRRRPSASTTPARVACTRAPLYQVRAGSGRVTAHPAYTLGPEARFARHSLSTGQTIRHVPYPSPASLSPVHPRDTSLGDAQPGSTGRVDASFDPDYEPAQPTICPADLELAGSCPSSRTPSLVDLSYAGMSDLQAAAMFSGGANGSGGGGGGSDTHMEGLDAYSAALAAATPTVVQNGSVDLSWFGVAQPFQPPVPQQRQTRAEEGRLFTPLA